MLDEELAGCTVVNPVGCNSIPHEEFLVALIDCHTLPL